METGSEFDYVVVGAGSAGCALAFRLTEDPRVRVALLEAGREDTNPMIHMPRGFAKLLAGEVDVARFPVSGSPGPDAAWPRGEVLGGSSSINGQVYMRGRPADYDGLNIPGWGWNEVGAAFRAMECHALGPGGDRGTQGPLRISVHPDRSPACDALIAAMVAQGAVESPDLNQEDGVAVGYQPRNVHRGRRQSAATAFLAPARGRGNLAVLTRARARRVVFEDRRAAGVEYRDVSGAVQVVRARREVILCAGALMSPKLLMLSGVGPGMTLRGHGIEVRHDAPEVGRNLCEQLSLMATYRLTQGSHNHRLRGVGLLKSVLQYALFRTGPLSHAVFELSAQFAVQPGANRPEAIFQFVPASAQADKRTGAIVPDRAPGATLCAYVTRPRSRGFMSIVSADPDVPAQYDPRYLTDAADREAAIAMLRRLREFFGHPALAQYGFQEIVPGPAVAADDGFIDWYLRNGTSSLHAIGTCRMGTDASSVVDPCLRVRGVEGLRVADISVLPEMVSTHTNAPAMMIGWRTGDLLRGQAACGA
ncbi:MAG: GMC family oxidoreductase [Gammaproteobacteria bacterium]